MKHSVIRYQFKVGSEEAWHKQVADFIAALDSDPDLKGRISYRCMKEKNSPGYYHLAAGVDDDAIKALQGKEFFKHYQAETRRVGGGEVQVTNLEIVAETKFRA
ncbi:MAG TPA: hypothetical protein VII91_03325 [Bauldia sp.]